jgi:transcriptional regulator with XRE-family HTH domain
MPMNLDDRTFLRELGLRIRTHRLALEWTQADLADRCHRHRTFIGQVERGERNLTILNLRLIAKVLRVPLGELVGGAGVNAFLSALPEYLGLFKMPARSEATEGRKDGEGKRILQDSRD